jgi:C-terminal processing protease CtpA/Prc
MKYRNAILSWSVLFFVAMGLLTHCGVDPTVTEPPSKREQTTEPPRTREPIVDASDGKEANLPQEQSIPEVHIESVSPDSKPPVDIIPRPATGWCSRLAAGVSAQKMDAIRVSYAHAMIRFFGTHSGYPDIDRSLAVALSKHKLTEPAMLSAYAAAHPSLCPLTAEQRKAAPIQVTKQDGVVIIQPGTGSFSLPKDTKAILIDLRNVPSTNDLQPILESIIAQALAKPMPMMWYHVRKHRGMKDEYFNAQNTYTNAITALQAKGITPKSGSPLPLAFIIGKRLPPIAAELAGRLRLAQRAWLIGQDIPTEIAETQWIGLGDVGIAYRYRSLLHNQVPWPDTIPADYTLEQWKNAIEALTQGRSIPPVSSGQATRRNMAPAHYFRQFHTQQLTKANVLAALLIAHGALRAFYPYFKTKGVGDRIDERLLEVMGTLAALEQSGLTGIRARNLLRRFGEAIRDGHCFVNSVHTSQELKGYFPILLDQLDGKPIVKRSGIPDIHVGDEVRKIDGVDAKTWFDNEYKRTSAATPQYKFDLAARELNTLRKSIKVTLRSPKGEERVVTVEPQPYSKYEQFLQSDIGRRAGFLGDLNAPDMYYVNLDRNTIALESVPTILKDAQRAKGLVLDMRGYPGPNAWQLVMHLSKQPLPTPFFGVFNWYGPNQKILVQTNPPLSFASPHLSVPAVYLIGPRTVSAAEHLGTCLKQAKRVTFVGRASAGTNGNITFLVLPAGLTFSFTGMEILWQDRKPFHGVGLVPDEQVAPTQNDVATGYDRVLRKAIDVLNAP